MARTEKRPAAGAPAQGTSLEALDRDRLANALIEVSTDALGALPGVLAGCDAESLHSFRIAIRRLVALRRLVPRERRPPSLRMCRPRLEAVARLGGPRRDLDLLIGWLGQPGVHRQVGAAMAVRLEHAFVRRRTAEQRRLRVGLGSMPCRDWLGGMDTQIGSAGPSSEGGLASHGDIARTIARIGRRVHRRALGLRRRVRFRRLHRLRKDLRTLRYMLEFAAPAFGGSDVEAAIADLHRAQRALGRVCDLRARRRILRRAALDERCSALRDAAMQLARYLHVRERRARKACVATVERLVREVPTLPGTDWEIGASAGRT